MKLNNNQKLKVLVLTLVALLGFQAFAIFAIWAVSEIQVGVRSVRTAELEAIIKD